MAKITVSLLRDLLNQVQKEEITFGRMVELLNEKASEVESSGAAARAWLSIHEK